MVKMASHHRYLRLLRASAEVLRACYPAARVGALCAAGLVSVVFAGCGELEPMREPEVVDLELTTDTLKASVRDAQRMIAELRADLEAQRGELAEAQIARAQLDGQVREVERRIIEARQVIELQREELAAARVKQTHAFQSSFPLQGRMKQPQKQPSGARKPHPVQDRRAAATPAALMPASADSPFEPEGEPQRNSQKQVSVQPGDTLWHIAQAHRVNVGHLRTLNQLTNDRILVGQTLRLPDIRSLPGAGDDESASTR
jgi:DNA-binding protein YbaB